MRVKTKDLTGIALDYAVALASGATEVQCDDIRWFFTLNSNTYVLSDDWGGMSYHPSTDWAQGGPIIEREKISTAYEPSMIYDDTCRWKALSTLSDNDHYYGPTPLIAAMRCYCCSKFGDIVDVPEELK